MKKGEVYALVQVGMYFDLVVFSNPLSSGL